MGTIWTGHALDRVAHRLGSLVTSAEVSTAVAANFGRFQPGRNYLVVKKFATRQYVKDLSVVPDGIAKGDWIVAVLDVDGTLAQVTTVELRKSTSQSATYANILK